MRALFLLILMVALLLVVGPAAAQEFVTPEGEAAAPPVVAVGVDADEGVGALIPVSVLKDLNESFTGQIQSMMSLAFGALMVFIVFVILPVVVALYYSNPAFRQTIKSAALEGIALAETEIVRLKDEAATNDVDWDDPIWEGLYDAVKSGRLRLEALEPPQTAAG